MVERIEMVHSITGTLMFVPVELVPAYEKAGHKRTAQVEPAEEGETEDEPAEEGETEDEPAEEGETENEPAEEGKAKKNK